MTYILAITSLFPPLLASIGGASVYAGLRKLGEAQEDMMRFTKAKRTEKEGYTRLAFGSLFLAVAWLVTWRMAV